MIYDYPRLLIYFLIPLIITAVPVIGIALIFKGKYLAKRCKLRYIAAILILIFFYTCIFLVYVYLKNFFYWIF